MKNLLRLEELAFLGLAVYLFAKLPFAWWWFPLLLLTPDIGMIGYLAGPRLGAATYNLVHHRGLAIGVFLLGAYFVSPGLQLAGVIMLGHSSMDRVFGYGLKHMDSFQHTHLGWIGREAGG